tara:strand:- start:4318 stop:5505 length:1188 start_codon:yes stop_codon:yes gene_type:complete
MIPEINAVHFEASTLCVAGCPGCPRNYNGHSTREGFPKHSMSIDEFKKIFGPHMHTIREWLFCGNFGDPLNCHDLEPILDYINEHEHQIVKINTNGNYKTPEWWATLAKYDHVSICFALDGSTQDTHKLYRQFTKFDRILANAKAYIDAGGDASWQMILFEHNEHQIEEARQMSIEYGFSKFFTVDHDRDNMSVFDAKGNFSHIIKPQSHKAPRDDGWRSIDNLKKSIESRRAINNKVVKHKYDLSEEGDIKFNCNVVESNRIYVCANGEVYPCCFLGLYPKTYGSDELAVFKNYLTFENNANNRDILDILQDFQFVKNSWQKPSVEEGLIKKCLTECGQCVQPEAANPIHAEWSKDADRVYRTNGVWYQNGHALSSERQVQLNRRQNALEKLKA